MSDEPTAPTPRDQATNDPAPLDPTRHVTVDEIAEFLRHLTELRVGGRGDDPALRVTFLARKADLLTRLAADPSTPPASRWRTS